MRRRGGLRRRFLVGALASAAISLAVFGAVVFAVVAGEDDEDDGAEDTPVAEAGELVGWSMLLAAPIGVIAAVATAAALTRRIARPLESAIEAARRTSVHDLSRRLDVPAEDGELRDLALAQNELFARLDDGFGALARFAADASHELRTPLAVMAIELEVALRQPSNTIDWEQLATGTLHEARRMASVVEGLLSLARAGADAPGTRHHVALLDVVDAVVAQLTSAASARGVVLTGPVGDVDATVDANPATLETAIRNLVDNAVRHARSHVHVALTAEPARAITTVVIDDDGPGLGEHPEQLFAPLVRGSTADRSAGAGLGLAIARRIIEAHRGTISAATAPAGGARLTLTLPIAPPA